jgi:hypothetical protein
MFFFSLISVSAFDVHKQYTDYDLTISHNLATSCQTTWISLPNGSQNILNLDMTKDGTTFYSTIASGNFSSLGTTCLGISCTDGSTTEVGSKCIDITTGDWMFWIILILSFSFIFLSLSVVVREELFVYISGVCFTIAGVVIMINGLVSK